MAACAVLHHAFLLMLLAVVWYGALLHLKSGTPQKEKGGGGVGEGGGRRKKKPTHSGCQLVLIQMHYFVHTYFLSRIISLTKATGMGHRIQAVEVLHMKMIKDTHSKSVATVDRKLKMMQYAVSVMLHWPYGHHYMYVMPHWPYGHHI